MSISTVLACDECGIDSSRQHTITLPLGHKQRLLAVEAGWLVQAENLASEQNTGTKDFCGECRDKFWAYIDGRSDSV